MSGSDHGLQLTPTKREDYYIPKFSDFCLKVSVATLVLL